MRTWRTSKLRSRDQRIGAPGIGNAFQFGAAADA
jgi:hypothetical protein